MGPVAVAVLVPGRTTVRAAGVPRFPWAEPDRAGGYGTTPLAAVPRAVAAPTLFRGPSPRASGVHGRPCRPGGSKDLTEFHVTRRRAEGAAAI